LIPFEGCLGEPLILVPQRGEVVGFRQKTAEIDEASVFDMPSITLHVWSHPPEDLEPTQGEPRKPGLFAWTMRRCYRLTSSIGYVTAPDHNKCSPLQHDILNRERTATEHQLASRRKETPLNQESG
jgi:hypothetical protein